VLVEVDPWAGGPVNPPSPDEQVRTMSFGPGHAVAIQIVDAQRKVDLVQIAWPTWPGPTTGSATLARVARTTV
jgi:hypothetical protein